jgi:hypothetical protein
MCLPGSKHCAEDTTAQTSVARPESGPRHDREDSGILNASGEVSTFARAVMAFPRGVILDNTLGPVARAHNIRGQLLSTPT